MTNAWSDETVEPENRPTPTILESLFEMIRAFSDGIRNRGQL